ncbi:MAG: response regulator transcription factor [Hyphomicrobiaceae bacterium]|nr:response regulator transcription factor [Hyphomicrobiaceae bacterium]
MSALPDVKETTSAHVVTGAAEPHVLVVDDDSQLRVLVGKFLRSHGYRVTSVGTAPEMQHALASSPIDLVILDLMLPGASGLDLCRGLRSRSAIPIIMLTAKSEEADRIVGLEVGADDYVTKPFSPRELLARIKAVLRRTAAEPGSVHKAALHRGYTFDGWRLDALKRELTNPAGIVVDLSTGEYDLLLALVEQPQKVLTREQLLDAARNRIATGFDRSIDVQISRLRRKIDDGDDDTSMIKTVRGVGYMFTPTVTWS